jgi:uncharacterized protein DUF6868
LNWPNVGAVKLTLGAGQAALIAVIESVWTLQLWKALKPRTAIKRAVQLDNHFWPSDNPGPDRTFPNAWVNTWKGWLMNIEILRSALLWCTILNFGFYLLWIVIMLTPHEWLHRVMTARLIHCSPEQFDQINLNGILFYKVAIVLLNLVPYIALCIVK